MTKVAALVVLCVFLSYSLLAEAAPGVEFRAAGVDADGCDCITTLELRPVCGSDGRSYPNRGTLNCANECNRSNIVIVRDGLC